MESFKYFALAIFCFVFVGVVNLVDIVNALWKVLMP